MTTEQLALFGEPGGTERVEALDALQEGDLVRHRLVPKLVGRKLVELLGETMD